MYVEKRTPLRVAVGHIIPGTIFILLGLRWFCIIMNRHFLCLREASLMGERARKFKSSFTFPVGKFKSLAAEAFILVSLGLVGLMVELHFYNPSGYLIHNTLYLTWGAASAVEAMVQLKFPVPYGLEYIAMVLAGFSNATVMYSHSGLYAPFSKQCHRDLIVILCLVIISLLLEMKYRYSVLPAASRAFSTFLMGTWWWSVGLLTNHFIPSFANLGDDVMSLTLLQVIFVAQIYITFVFCIILSVIIYFKVKRMSPEEVHIALDKERIHELDDANNMKYIYPSETPHLYHKLINDSKLDP